jgi:hypothetical protein
MPDLITLLKEAKRYSKETGSLTLKLKALRIDERTLKIKDEKDNAFKVFFKFPHRLTIFEAGLLYSLIVLKKKPRDYAGYFKCQAGKEFLDSIEKISILKKKVIWEESD